MSDELLHHQLGSYRLVQRLGRGAFGSVYLGKHFLLEHKPPVAVKVLNTTLRSQDELDRFFQEALLLDKLTHPNILQVLDANIYEEYPFFVAEFAANGSLQERLEQLNGQPMQLAEALRIVTQIGQALQYAHDLDVIHRDLKPANILFNAEDDALLADFGISVQLDRTGRVEMVGTPIYMAPEQFKGLVSKKSDQYALACVAYELLTGQLLFSAEDPYEIGYKHIYEPPIELREINPAIPDAIEQVVLKALSKHRDDRYETVEDFMHALQKAAGHASQAPSQPSYPTHQQSTPPVAQPSAHVHQVSHVHDTPHVLHAAYTPHVPHVPKQQEPHVPHEHLEDDPPDYPSEYLSMHPATHLHQHPVQEEQPQGIVQKLGQWLHGSSPKPAISRLTPLWTQASGLDHTYYAEPTLANGMLYAGTYPAIERNHAENFQVHCLDIATGKLIWAFITEQSLRSAPVVVDGILYVCAGHGETHGKIYALDAATGEEVWSLGTKEALLSAPHVADGAVYFHSRHGLYAVDADSGRKRWAIAVEEGIFAPPMIVHDVVYVSTQKGNCYGLDAATGHRRSLFADVGNIYAAAQARHGVICVGLYSDGLYGDDAVSGKTLWYATVDKQLSGAGITIDGQTIYVASHGGHGENARELLFSIDLNTGNQHWAVPLKHITAAPPVIVNGVIYVSTFGGELYAIDAEQGRILASTVVGTKKPTRPAIAENLLVVSVSDIHAYQIG